jgi:hypothetical protein
MQIAAVTAAVGVAVVGAAVWDKTRRRSNPSRGRAAKRGGTKSKPKKRAARRSAAHSKKRSGGSRIQFARQTAEQFLGDASIQKIQHNLESLQRQLDASKAKNGHVDQNAQLYMEAVAELLRKKIKAQEAAAKAATKVHAAAARASGRAPSPAVQRAIAPVAHEASEREILAKYRASSYETLLKYLENIQAAIAHGGPQTAQMKHAEKNIKKVLMEKLRKNPSAYRKNPTRFDRCVRGVKASARRTGYPLKSAEGVCAAVGRRAYGKKKFQAMAAAGRKKSMRRNPPLMEGSAVTDLQQSIAPRINKMGKADVRYSETGSGDLLVSGKIRASSGKAFSIGYVSSVGNHLDLKGIAARHGFRFGYSDNGDALLFRKL